MTAQIIDMPTVTHRSGNGAREALIDLAVRWSDFILAEFWARGFKVVPVETDI